MVHTPLSRSESRSTARAVWILPGLTLLALSFAACGGSEDDNQDPCQSATTDSDADGLTDCHETELYGTSSILADTDGDGLNDGQEIVELGFSASNNNFKFNPLIADLPEIGIELATLPDIRMLYTDTSSNTTERSVSRTDTSVSAESTTNSTQNSTSVEVSVTQKRSGSRFVIFNSPVSKYSRSRTETTTETETLGWSETHSSENSQAFSQAESWAETTSNTLTGGSILTTVRIANRGDLSFTVSTLSLAAVMLDPFSGDVMTPVGNLSFDTSSATWEPFTLGPGAATGNMVFSNTALDAGITQQLLTDSSGLMVEVATFELTNEENVGFNHNLTEVMARTASVVIDYGLDEDNEGYRVATNVDNANLRISAGAALSDILRIPFTTNADGALTGVRDRAQDVSSNSYWLVAHASTDGVVETLDEYDPIDGGYDFAGLSLKSGDVLHLIYFADPDSDLLGARQEFSFRSYTHLADSDADGLQDGDEVYGFGLHPVRSDTDEDGKNDPLERFLFVSAGGLHSVAIAANSTLWAWGHDGFYQVGMPTAGRCDVTYQERCITSPTQVGADDDWAQVSAGHRHTLALKENGSLWAWGDNEAGLLGTGLPDTCYGTVPCTQTPTLVGGDTDWQTISAGGFFNVAIKTDGTLWAWGKNDRGQLGLGDTSDRGTPIRVGPDDDWARVDAGYNHTLALKTDGTLWAWGLNYDGRLGATSSDTCGTHACSLTPIAVGTDAHWVAVAAGMHSAAIQSDGTLWTWGKNGSGELGLGDDVDRAEPARVGTATWDAVSAGHHFTIARATNGTLWGWGGNWFAQLGIVTFDTCPMGSCTQSPLPLGAETGWLDVDAGANFVLALRDFHTIWDWGSNQWGQLGRPTSDNCNTSSAPHDCSESPVFVDP